MAGQARDVGFVRGALFLGVCVAAAIRLGDHQPWGAIAIGNAIAHLLLGLLWTGYWLSARPRLVARQLWFMTIFTGIGLLVYSLLD